MKVEKVSHFFTIIRKTNKLKNVAKSGGGVLGGRLGPSYAPLLVISFYIFFTLQIDFWVLFTKVSTTLFSNNKKPPLPWYLYKMVAQNMLRTHDVK